MFHFWTCRHVTNSHPKRLILLTPARVANSTRLKVKLMLMNSGFAFSASIYIPRRLHAPEGDPCTVTVLRHDARLKPKQGLKSSINKKPLRSVRGLSWKGRTERAESKCLPSGYADWALADFGHTYQDEFPVITSSLWCCRTTWG